MKDIEIKIEEGKEIDYTRVELQNGVTLHISQLPSGSAQISVFRMTEKTFLNIMKCKVTKKLNSLGNTRIRVVE